MKKLLQMNLILLLENHVSFSVTIKFTTVACGDIASCSFNIYPPSPFLNMWTSAKRLRFVVSLINIGGRITYFFR